MNFDTIADKIQAGEELNREEGLFLLQANGPLEKDLLALARNLNERINGTAVTYIHNRNINFTNVCTIRCRFCAFCRENTHPEAFTLRPEEILDKLRETPGVSEVCIQGGIHPGLGISYYLEFLRRIKADFPSLHIHGISPQEIHFLTEQTGRGPGKVIELLMAAGLDSMAGTAAEILAEPVRRRIAPGKINTARWVEIIKTAHGLGLPSTATILFGHIESDADLLEHLGRLRAIQRETGRFTEFIPLPFIPDQTPLGAECPRPAGLAWPRIKRFYALARVYLSPTFRNLQTSWVKLGVERAVETLEAGVNDFGGTLYEENITRSAGGRFGQFLSEREIRTVITRTGREPRRRNTLYQTI